MREKLSTPLPRVAPVLTWPARARGEARGGVGKSGAGMRERTREGSMSAMAWLQQRAFTVLI